MYLLECLTRANRARLLSCTCAVLCCWVPVCHFCLYLSGPNLTSNRGHYLFELFIVFIVFYLFWMKLSMHSILFSQISTTNAMKSLYSFFLVFIVICVMSIVHVNWKLWELKMHHVLGSSTQSSFFSWCSCFSLFCQSRSVQGWRCVRVTIYDRSFLNPADCLCLCLFNFTSQKVTVL